MDDARERIALRGTHACAAQQSDAPPQGCTDDARTHGCADDARTWFELGLEQCKRGQFANAATSLQRSLAIRPDNAIVLNELGRVLSSLGDAAGAKRCYGDAIARDPSAPAPHYNLALLVRNESPAQAQACLREAVRLNPGFSFAWNALGLLLHDMRRFDEAALCYRRALASMPDNLPAQVNLGMTLLMLGRYEEGWRLYEARHEQQTRGADLAWNPIGRSQIGIRRWRGEPLRGYTLLVWPEQGLGDIIQFVRFISLLREQGAARVTVACWPELEALLKESIGGVDWLRLDAGTSIPNHDYWCFLTSLPHLLNTTLDTLPDRLPYLRAPAGRIEAARRTLPHAARRVGLVWGSGQRGAFAENGRSIPLAACMPLFEVEDVTFVSLQMGPAKNELIELRDAVRPMDEIPMDAIPIDVMQGVRDLADTAALIASLDLVISVDTSIAHLAGAVGAPVWILLRHAACWRWIDDRSDTPWYPGNARLFRQPAPGEWAPVVAQAKAALVEWVRAQRKPVDF